jgi:hypothetical protein
VGVSAWGTDVANPATDPVSVITTPLPDGATIVATQIIGGVEGPPSAGVVATLPAPTVASPIVPDSPNVTLLNELTAPGATASLVPV